MAQSSRRKKPNILVTGTPGQGRRRRHHYSPIRLSSATSTSLSWSRRTTCTTGGTKSLGATSSMKILLQVCDELEDQMEEGGNIVDYHGCDFFPECWFDRVVVFQTNNSVLYDRLNNRGYMGSKLTNNVECEIFQVLLEEAKSSYPEDIVMAMQSDSVDDISRNVGALTDWIRSWTSAHPKTSFGVTFDG